MTTEAKPSLPAYGQPAAWDAPVGVAIWGARWIYPDDMVFNRQAFNEVETGQEQLQTWLNEDTGSMVNRIELAGEQAVKMHRDYTLRSNSKEVVTLYEDDRGIIRGNPNGSYGYLYVAAWLKPNDEGVNQ